MSAPGGLLVLASTLAVGGGERVLATLVEGLVDRGVPVHLFFLKEPGAIGEALVARGVEATALGLSDTRRPRALLALLRVLRRAGPELLYIQDHHDCLFWGRLAAALAAFLPTVSPVHSSAQGDLRAFRSWNRILLGLSPHLVTLGDWQRRALREREGLAPGLWRTIPNPVRREGWPPCTAPEQSPRLELVTVAALRPEKRLDRMILLARALGALRPLRLTLVGDGPERERLEDLARETTGDGEIVFAGRREDVGEQLRGKQLFLLTSAEEALPVSVLEAMCAGLPVAAPPHGALPELLADRRLDLLLEGEDPEVWARQIHDFMVRPPESGALLARAERIAAAHAPERFLDEHLRFFRGLGLG